MIDAHQALHTNMYAILSKDLGAAAFEVVYGTVYIGVHKRVRTSVYNKVFDAVFDAVYEARMDIPPSNEDCKLVENLIGEIL